MDENTISSETLKQLVALGRNENFISKNEGENITDLTVGFEVIQTKIPKEKLEVNIKDLSVTALNNLIKIQKFEIEQKEKNKVYYGS